MNRVISHYFPQPQTFFKLFSSSRLSVVIAFFLDSPKIDCFSTEANLGQKDVFLRCHVRCKPDYSALFWLIDSNGTTLSEGDVINGHWMTVKVRQVSCSSTPRHYFAQMFLYLSDQLSWLEWWRTLNSETFQQGAEKGIIKFKHKGQEFSFTSKLSTSIMT